MIVTNYIKATGDSSRPTDWLPMPNVTSSNDIFVGLYAIFPEGNNFAAFNFTTSTGQYQVDWGDGTITLYNSGVTAEYEYNYSTYDIGNNTLTSRGYKQAIIKVTAVSGLLRTCNFDIRYTGQTIQYSTGFLDCILSMPYANSGSSIIFGGITNVAHRFCEIFNIITIGSCTSLLNMFTNCSSLQTLPLFNTINVTTMRGMFTNCSSLQTLPLFNTINVTTMQQMFSNCTNLKKIPALLTTSTSSFVSFVQSSSLSKCEMAFNNNISFLNCQLSKTAIEEILTNLLSRTSTSATIDISGNYGVGTIVSRTFTTTNGSTTITTADTSGLVAGMQVTGTNSPLTTPVAVTFQDAGDTVTLIAHGLENNDEVSFATVVTTTGITLNTIYYIVNKTTDTFQLSTSIGGSAIPLTTNGTGTMRHRTEIVSIVPNTSITMSRPMRGTGTPTLAFRLLRTGTALLKNWVVTG